MLEILIFQEKIDNYLYDLKYQTKIIYNYYKILSSCLY